MKSKQIVLQSLAAVALIALAAGSRLLPHPLNFTPVAAIALFGGVYLDKRLALAIPLAAMLVSDAFLGFYGEMLFVYGSFVGVGLIGLWIRNHKSVLSILGGTLAGSVLFFIVTNFGVWVIPGSMYAKNLAGLAECYTAAIPFFRSSVEGDVIFVTVLFGVYELVALFIRKSVPAERAALR